MKIVSNGWHKFKRQADEEVKKVEKELNIQAPSNVTVLPPIKINNKKQKKEESTQTEIKPPVILEAFKPENATGETVAGVVDTLLDEQEVARENNPPEENNEEEELPQSAPPSPVVSQEEQVEEEPAQVVVEAKRSYMRPVDYTPVNMMIRPSKRFLANNVMNLIDMVNGNAVKKSALLLQ